MGRICINDQGLPELICQDGAKVLMQWRDVTFRRGNPKVLGPWMKRVNWQHTARGISQTIATGWVIAVWDPELRRYSMTALSRNPLPVDHLVEQFADQSEIKGGFAARSFIVAAVERDCLTLEVAPSRYVELPLDLIRPLHDGDSAENLDLCWRQLGVGDIIWLEWIRQKDSTFADFVPLFSHPKG